MLKLLLLIGNNIVKSTYQDLFEFERVPIESLEFVLEFRDDVAQQCFGARENLAAINQNSDFLLPIQFLDDNYSEIQF